MISWVSNFKAVRTWFFEQVILCGFPWFPIIHRSAFLLRISSRIPNLPPISNVEAGAFAVDQAQQKEDQQSRERHHLCHTCHGEPLKRDNFIYKMDQNGTSPWFSGWYVHNRLDRQFLLGGASNNIPGWEAAGCKLNATKTQMMNVFVRLERDEFSRFVVLFSSPKAPYPELYSVFCQEKHHWCGFFSTGRYSMRHLWIAAKTCFLAHSLTLLLTYTCWLACSTDFTYPLSSPIKCTSQHGLGNSR